MRFWQHEVQVATRGRGLHDLTPHVVRAVEESGVDLGLVVAHCLHTSASLLIQENADPSVGADVLDWLERLAPDGAGYRHSAEGPDDMAAHLRSALTRTSETVPVRGGRPVLGRWQGLYLLEHRTAPHQRRVLLHVQGRGAQ